jgi:hypothetical protein
VIQSHLCYRYTTRQFEKTVVLQSGNFSSQGIMKFSYDGCEGPQPSKAAMDQC